MKRATFVKVALAMMVAVAATFGGGSAFAQGKVIKMIPQGDLKIIDPIWRPRCTSTRNHGYMIYDTLFADDPRARSSRRWSTGGRSPTRSLGPSRFATVSSGTTARR